MREKIWDLGPQAPKAPAKPEPPKGKDGDPDYELAKVEFEHALAIYREDLLAYGRQTKEYREWKKRDGGPVQIDLWTVDANEAMRRDPDRYVKSLPRGTKPGRAHFENLEREKAREEDLEADRKRDPQFGGAAA